MNVSIQRFVAREWNAISIAAIGVLLIAMSASSGIRPETVTGIAGGGVFLAWGVQTVSHNYREEGHERLVIPGSPLLVALAMLFSINIVFLAFDQYTGEATFGAAFAGVLLSLFAVLEIRERLQDRDR